MPMTRLLTIAASTALLAGTAHAQAVNDTTHIDEDGATVTTRTVVVDPAAGPASAAAAAGVAASAVMADPDGAPGTLTISVVTNGPIPDTPENRAKYGQPNSRTGRATVPAGN